MLQRIFFSILLLFHIGNHEVMANWSGTIDYGGISLECTEGCGYFDYDRLAYKIADKFYQSIVWAFSTDCYLYNQEGKRRKFEPYPDDSGEFTWQTIEIVRYNWEKARGIFIEMDLMEGNVHWNHPYFTEESYKFGHAGLIKAYERVHADLLFYRDQQIKFLRRKLAWNQHKLLIYEGYKMQGYTHLVFDGETYKIMGPIDINILPKEDQDGNYVFIDREMYMHQRAIQAVTEDLNKMPFQTSIDCFEQTFREIDVSLKKWFLRCLKYHQLEGVTFDKAVEAFLIGDYFSAIEYVRTLIDLLEKYQFNSESISKVYFLKGQLQAEVSLHGDAILSLTDAIRKNPELKEAYFERAISYFEVGEFERALDDYLISGFKKNIPLEWSLVSLGIGAGIVEGSKAGVSEFIPSLLNSVRGLGHGLWALCADPVGSIEEVSEAAIICLQYMKNHSALDAVQQMVPELKELVQDYDMLDDYKKGHLIGSVIGKYGIDIFLGGGTTKAFKCYRELKRANQFATLEAFASPKNTQKILEEANRKWLNREETLKNATLQIHKGKQEKHIQGKKNFESGKSIFQHDDPERLIKEYAGTGIKDPLYAKTIPGTAGYKEIVNFEDKIGMAVNEFTGIETPTSWGKIHYAKDGVHIVPTFPPKY